MREKNDPLAEIRDLLEAPHPVRAVKQEDFALHETVGIQPRFQGKQEIRVIAVGHNVIDHVLLETHDLKGSTWNLTRWLPVEMEQVPALLKALLHAEVLDADIKVTQPAAWPEFPIPLADIPYQDGGVMKVVLDHYQGYLDIKISKIFADGVARRSNLWAKFSPQFDVRPLGGLLIAAFDQIMKSADAEVETSEDSIEDEMVF